MGVSLALRFRILRRDRFRCHYCGAEPAQEQLEVDHVEPRAKGGKDAEWNLVAACVPCNRGKRAAELDPDQVFEIQEMNRCLMDWRRYWQEATGGLEIPDSMLWAYRVLRRRFGYYPLTEAIGAVYDAEPRTNEEALQAAWRGFNAGVDLENSTDAELLLG